MTVCPFWIPCCVYTLFFARAHLLKSSFWLLKWAFYIQLNFKKDPEQKLLTSKYKYIIFMNRPLFSHVPLAMASCPQLLACETLYGKITLLEEYTFPCCAQGRFSKNILMKKMHPCCREKSHYCAAVLGSRNHPGQHAGTDRPQHYREILIQIQTVSDTVCLL